MNPDEIIDAISHFSGPELIRVRDAVKLRREQLIKQSTVAERRNHGRGILQLEYRSNPKTGTTRGPYWYFYWQEGGKQRSLYLGKTDNPEEALSTTGLAGPTLTTSRAPPIVPLLAFF